eukprot:Hpha_TRINITY_DN16652_c3_g6::TRINITY_DN16652_c3_g6_i1::g.181802::m.181802
MSEAPADDAIVKPEQSGLLVGRLRDIVAGELQTNAEAKWCDDQTILRYIRAQVHNKPKDKVEKHLKNASEQLIGTIKWRREQQPELRGCRKCQMDPTSHCMRVLGVDRIGRPVVYTCFSQAMHRTDVDANVDHMLWCMEECVRVMNEGGRGAESWVWIVDYHGYSMRVDSSPTTASRCAQMLAHYPERLGKAFCVDAGWLFESTWAIIRRIVNERTASKVGFVRSADLHSALSEMCDEEVIQWVAAEMADNRTRKPPNWQKDPTTGKRWWAPPDEPGGHDSRGTSSYLRSPLFKYPPWLSADQKAEEGITAPPARSTDNLPGRTPSPRGSRRPSVDNSPLAVPGQAPSEEPEMVTAVQWSEPCHDRIIDLGWV